MQTLSGMIKMHVSETFFKVILYQSNLSKSQANFEPSTKLLSKAEIPKEFIIFLNQVHPKKASFEDLAACAQYS